MNMEFRKNMKKILIGWVLVLASLGYVILQVFDFRKNLVWHYALVLVFACFTLAVSLVALIFFYLQRNELGGYAVIVSVWSNALPIGLLFEGAGLFTALLSMIFSAMIANIFLPKKLRPSAMLGGTLVGLICLACDLFDFKWQLTKWSPIASLVAISTLIILGLVYIGRSFRSMSLRIKLVVSFVMVSLFSVTIIAFVTNYITKNSLIQSVGVSLNVIAESQALEAGNAISKQVDLLSVFILDDVLQQEVMQANLSYLEKDTAEIKAEIQALDKEWIAASKAKDSADPLVVDRLNTATAKLLKKFNLSFPDNVELLVTDRYGALVSAWTQAPSNQIAFPSDYNQSDEGWWISSYNHGDGKIYVANPEYDESSNAYSINIAIPILKPNTGETIGVIRTTYLLNRFVSLSSKKIGETGNTDIVFLGQPPIHMATGALEPVNLHELEQILGLSPSPNLNDLQVRLYDRFRRITKPFLIMDYEGSESVIASAPIVSENKAPLIQDLKWLLVVHQNYDEALLPATQQSKISEILSVIVAVIMASLGIGFSQAVSTPIIHLTHVAEQIASGDLSAQAKVYAEDEVGVLARTLNTMTRRLSETLEGLELRVSQRTRAIETSAVVGRQLSTILNPAQLVKAVVEQLQEAFHYYHVNIYLFDKGQERLVMMGGSGEAGKLLLEEKHYLSRGRGLVGQATETGSVVLVPDTSVDPNWLPNSLLPETKSEIVVPIMIGEQVLGALDVQHNVVNGLSQQDSDVLQLIASQVAVALRNSQLYEEAQKQVQRQLRFNAIVEQIRSTTSVESALQIAVREVGRAIKASKTSIILGNEYESEHEVERD